MSESNMEGPFDVLDIDPALYTPGVINFRMLKITNALMDLYRQRGENQKHITELRKRSGDDYVKVRGEQYVVEDKIRALETKYETLKSMNYNHNAEMKHLSR